MRKITAGNFVSRWAKVSSLRLFQLNRCMLILILMSKPYLKYAQLANTGQRADARVTKPIQFTLALANENAI